MIVNKSRQSDRSAAAPMATFFELQDVPIYCNLLWSDADSAKNCPKGDIRLALDTQTGLISNLAFDADRLSYSQDYENSLHYSPHFQKYAKDLALELIHRYQLKGKRIIEIGCGKGDFLISLCDLGDNQGIGFDPTYISRQEHSSKSYNISFIRDYYSDRYQGYCADFICCRHTLEHILDPGNLLLPLKRAVDGQHHIPIFFEVPNTLHTFENLAIWDIIYEHCCYFTPISLAHVFTAHGFQVHDVWSTFENQFLCIEAFSMVEMLPEEVPPPNLDTLQRTVDSFTQTFLKKIDEWEQRLDQCSKAQKRTVIWGAGSKGVMFLNLLKEYNFIRYAVDLNPRKTGKFIPGTGQEIVSPEFLKQYQPELVIIMNSIYEAEIHQQCHTLGLTPEFMNA